MNNKQFSWRELSASFLLMLMGIAVLIKPLHVFIIDHSFLYNSVSNHFQEELNNSRETNCPICDFEFCQIIPHDAISLPAVASFPYNDHFALQKIVDVHRVIIQLSLRGPPLFFV